MNRPIVRPRDAAGLVLLRGRGRDREVLLGRRSQKSRFLPGVYVFPGGGLEVQDSRPTGFPERWQPLPGGIDQATRRKSSALLRAAFRETLEETGVMLGRPLGTTPPNATEAGPAWQAYRSAGLAPAFERARLLVRAITPTRSPIRFHTRFFVADATGVHHGEPHDDELEDVAWVPVDALSDLPMIDVTLYVLEQALRGPQPVAGLFGLRDRALRDDLKERLKAHPGPARPRSGA